MGLAARSRSRRELRVGCAIINNNFHHWLFVMTSTSPPPSIPNLAAARCPCWARPSWVSVRWSARGSSPCSERRARWPVRRRGCRSCSAPLVALLLGYTISKLSTRFPSKGGIVSYLHQGFGDSRLTGIASWLFYIAGIIVTAMVSLSFGSYARGLFLPDDSSEVWVKVFATIAVIAMALVYVLGAEAVGRLQSIVVMILLAVFVVFIIATFSEIDLDLLAPSTYPSVADIVAAVALTFFAYLGFAVVATTAESIADPARSVPRATYLALLIAGGLYVLISLGVYGTLTVDQVIASGDTALAEAAEPALGQAGYTMMAIAALLATGSSINANLFAAGNLTASLAGRRASSRVCSADR